MRHDGRIRVPQYADDLAESLGRGGRCASGTGLDQRDGVADLGGLQFLDAGDDVADFAGFEPRMRRLLGTGFE